MVDEALGHHSARSFEALANRSGIAIFEAFDDHEQHDGECTPLLKVGQTALANHRSGPAQVPEYDQDPEELHEKRAILPKPPAGGAGRCRRSASVLPCKAFSSRTPRAP